MTKDAPMTNEDPTAVVSVLLLSYVLLCLVYILIIP